MISSAPEVPRPDARPANPRFSCGPCTKRPGWSLAALDAAWLGRSHRAPGPTAALAEVIERSRALLGMPAGWRLAIVPGSDTGAVEMAMWSMLGARGVDVISMDSFSRHWAVDAMRHLPVDARVLEGPNGCLPDLAEVDFSRDVVFAWNGTTAGVCFADGTWIPQDRAGLAICDATSAAFAMALPWEKLDVVTWSWQKVLGGEAGHGMLAIGPRAAERLQGYTPPWPLPRLFRMTEGGVLNEALFRGDTINTPSMLCVADALDALGWAERIGGLPAMIARSQASLAAVSAWVAGSGWARFVAPDPATRSSTSICLAIDSPWFAALDVAAQRQATQRMAAMLEAEGVALDVLAFRDAPPGFRVWGGSTVEPSDMALLLPWLDWAHAAVAAEHALRRAA